MLFNSFEVIFAFVPLLILTLLVLSKVGVSDVIFKVIILLFSFYFYSYLDFNNLLLLTVSLLFNFFVAAMIRRSNRKRLYLIAGITCNLLALGYFKYTNFILENINTFLNFKLDTSAIVLPLAISFYTFQQIALLVDIYKDSTIKHSLLDHSLFVTFFPHLIAGPIVLHNDLTPQFVKFKNFILIETVKSGR